jgi:hypothetical protein
MDGSRVVIQSSRSFRTQSQSSITRTSNLSFSLNRLVCFDTFKLSSRRSAGGPINKFHQRSKTTRKPILRQRCHNPASSDTSCQLSDLRHLVHLPPPSFQRASFLQSHSALGYCMKDLFVSLIHPHSYLISPNRRRALRLMLNRA